MNEAGQAFEDAVNAAHRDPMELVVNSLAWVARNPEAVVVILSAAYILAHLGVWWFR